MNATEQAFYADLSRYNMPCVLSSVQVSVLLRRGVSKDVLYCVNSDVYCGYSFAQAFHANVPKQDRSFKFRLCQFPRKASEHWMIH